MVEYKRKGEFRSRIVIGYTVRLRKSPVGVRWAVRCALRPRGCGFPVASGARALSARTLVRPQPTTTQLASAFSNFQHFLYKI